MNDEAMKMARRIVNEVWEAFGALSTKERAEKAALAAIIETQERCAAVAENYFGPRNALRSCGSNIGRAIRSGQQFRKDVR